MFFMGIFKNIAKILLADIVKDIGKEILKNKDLSSKKDFHNILSMHIKNKKIDKKIIILKKIEKIKETIIKKDALSIKKTEKIKILSELTKLEHFVVTRRLDKINYEKIEKVLSEFDEDNIFKKTNFEVFLINLENLIKPNKVKITNKNMRFANKNIKLDLNFKNLKNISKFLRDYKKVKIYLANSHKLTTKRFKNIKNYLNDINEFKLKTSSSKNLIGDHLKRMSTLRKLISEENSHTFHAMEHNLNTKKDLLNRKYSFELNHLNLKSFNSFNKVFSHSQKNIYTKKILSFENNIIFQIKKNLSNHLNKEITIKLHPPELGKIKILLTMNNNDLHGKITTENNIVKDAILNNLQVLNQALKDKGINLSNFQVFVSGEFAENKENSKRWNNKKEKHYNFNEKIINNEQNYEYVSLLEMMENNFNLKV